MLLSNNDIKRELIKAKKLSIYPLILENIKASSINLTASAHAWDIKGNSVVSQDKKKIIVKASTTVSIHTQEAIWVSRRIGGTYHPRVSMVAKGLSNISTTLDPQWYGLSLVTVSNITDQDIEIKVGEGFVSVMLYYLNSPAEKGNIDNQASRPDLYSRFKLTDDDRDFLNQQWHKNHPSIVAKMKSSDTYKELVKDQKRFTRGIKRFVFNPLIVGVLAGIIGGVITGIIIFKLGMN
ncbi:hypothetical protein ACIQW7_27915 [Peribacillus simplex]|uniref:hypothetical protein n=1 Tax=Peribacillus simplex TaxID=1478 RepID=UPI001D9EC046|nr:hypothetical protein [Peribacillus simplex]MED4096937.1 hypothetical protein [Peribacillus simplex]CAH0310193.1 Deoxycytidine triphosphate deaminase [Peribacillus simplex]